MSQLIAIIGGDARYLELIRQLKNRTNTTIVLVGFDKINQGFIGLNQMDFEDLELDKLDAVILPITGTDDEGNIEIVFSDQKIQLSNQWFQQLRSDIPIFTGMANEYLIRATNDAKVRLIQLLNHDDVAIYNSIPTAEGTIMMAIEHTDYTIHSSQVIVTGFGRVGNTVANKFSALGAKVAVSSRESGELARINERGLKAIPLRTLQHNTSNCDLLINTIPAQVITKDVIQHLPSHGIIIDLASIPGGTDFKYAKRRGIKAILAKSLPGIVAPKTAGKILANAIKNQL